MKKVRIFAASIYAVLIASLTACGVLDDDGQKKVKHSLKDESSSVFRDSRKSNSKADSTNKEVFCGEVNAKNIFGGMTGFKKYVVIDRLVLIDGESEAAIYDALGSEFESVRDAEIFNAKLTLLNLNMEADTKNLKQKNDDRTNKIDAETRLGRIPYTAFDIAWAENCK